MSYLHINWLMGELGDENADRPICSLSKGARVLAMELAWRANRQTGQCNPSLELLMEACDASEKSVYAWAKELEDVGFIKRKSTTNSMRIRTGTQYSFLRVRPVGEPFVFYDDEHADEQEGAPPKASGGSPCAKGPKGTCTNVPKGTRRKIAGINKGSSEEGNIEPRKANPLPLKAITEIWNQTCGASIGNIRKISPGRERHLRARWREEFNGDIEEWRRFCATIEASDFLSGRNGRWTKCNFDWVLNPDNCVKILEGKYGKKAPPPPDPTKPTAREFSVCCYIVTNGKSKLPYNEEPTEAEVKAVSAKWAAYMAESPHIAKVRAAAGL